MILYAYHPHVSRFTFHVSRFTFYVSRFTFHVLRFTFYVLRFTFYVSPPAGQVAALHGPAHDGAEHVVVAPGDDVLAIVAAHEIARLAPARRPHRGVLERAHDGV